MSYISIDELNLLNGELLPERTVLSTVSPFYGGGPEHGHGDNGAWSHGSDRGPTIVSACQAVNNPPLLGILGGSNSLTCVPAVVAG
ncbi:MAG: hypothetical protein WCA46_23370 [Actinocatenispora sp.]